MVFIIILYENDAWGGFAVNIRLIVDGPCDLPISYYEENNIILIPHGVHVDHVDYQDRIDIQPKELMNKMRLGAAPKTSQGPVKLILEAYEQVANAGEHGLYLVFSSGLSGTFSSATMLREQFLEEHPGSKISLVDSKCASIGFGLLVKACVEKVKSGASIEEVIATAEFYANHTEHLIVVDNLEYLARGGRMSKGTALVGGMLNIKPLIEMIDGRLVPVDKFRSKKKLLDAILLRMEERGEGLNEQVIGLPHADNLELALEWKSAIEERFGVTKFEIIEIGGAIGSHCGPGTVGVTFLNKLPS
ncbi:MAG: DegV family protein [Bacillales bacterium]|jgi:DegV family protein with EDD domain|nr:DegV family protein [Bacillales bacterium]